MTDMILIYITCRTHEEAEKLGTHLLNKRLCSCVNIFDGMQSIYFWPPKSGTIEKANESVLIVKTLANKFDAIEQEVTKVHSYTTPCLIAIPTTDVAKKYYAWIKGEVA
jgi:periplasmic divalent cation tolerance protein